MMETNRKAALLKKEARYFTGKACVQGHVAPRRAKTGECLECRTVQLKVWRKANPQKVVKHNASQYVQHAEKIKVATKAYFEANRDKCYKTMAAYREKNPHIAAKISAKRKAAMLQRIPKWLTPIDFERIDNEYKVARLLSKVTGSLWHVDHIIPLQGKLVSGLHVPENLKAIPAKENMTKNNHFEVTL